MTRVVAPSRLHFGLLNAGDLPGAARFGGCGLMVAAPGVVVRVEPAADWHGEGPAGRRAVEFARRVTAEPHRVVVERCPPEHVGLGVGTSLGLAVAKALRPDLTAVDLAPLVGRGRRSGVGVHGFDRGGFIADGGRAGGAALPALAGHLPFPADWRVVLILPDEPAGWHGPAEEAAFARRRDPAAAAEVAGRMHRLLAGDLGPGLEAREFDRFSLALGEYNRLAGAQFAADQGGTYAGRAVAAIVAAVRGLGFPGVGQSSWGPTVFAVCPDADRAGYLAEVVRARFPGLRSADVVAPAAGGAQVEFAA